MHETKPVGRALRLILGLVLLLSVVPYSLNASVYFTLTSLGVVVGLIIFYSAFHYLISRFLPNINRWVGAIIALIPLILLYVNGLEGGLIFGMGEGAMGAITFLGISYVIDYIRGDSGCEVMAIPGLLFKKRTHLACVVLTPVDILEAKLSRGRQPN